MSQDYSRLKDRIAQAIYVLGIVGAGFWIFCFIAVSIIHFFGIDRIREVGAYLFLYCLGAVASYSAGWGIRWVINGRTSSIFDRYRK